MTYYEFIRNLKILEKESRNNEAYQIITNTILDLYGDIKYRLGAHIIDFIAKKINNVYINIINRLLSDSFTLESFSLLIIELKNELNYIASFITLNAIDTDCQKDIKNVNDNLINKYNETLNDLIMQIYNEEYLREYNNIMKKENINEL